MILCHQYTSVFISKNIFKNQVITKVLFNYEKVGYLKGWASTNSRLLPAELAASTDDVKGGETEMWSIAKELQAEELYIAPVPSSYIVLDFGMPNK